MPISPTQRSLQECRRLGYVAGVVEKWVPGANIRQDLWGWCDIVALHPDMGDVYYIQCTSDSNHASRRAKVQAWEHLEALLQSPYAQAEVWSWKQRPHKNKDGSTSKVKRWTLRREVVTPQENQDAEK